MADPLGDDASFPPVPAPATTSSGPSAVTHGGPLLGVEFLADFRHHMLGAAKIEKISRAPSS